MNVHCTQHVAFEGLGSIEDSVRRSRYTLGATHFYRGHPLVTACRQAPEVRE